ncbi:MAG TPA: DUF2911 domain-containing protein [Saprospiraceae bacterium]|nr:DUF2911 domain-containing protein [Saprospiraceae bacterium]
MKAVQQLIGVLCLLTPLFTFAQIETPAPSPSAEIEQMVGLTEVEIEYSRPGMKGREIFGELVPYGQVWRTGANASTKITVSDDVKIGDLNVPEGTYSLVTIPGEDAWSIIISKKLEMWGSGDYDKSMDLGRFIVQPKKLKDKVETFTIDFSHLTSTDAKINLSWENTRVSFPIETNAMEQVEEQIKSVLVDGPDAGTYYSAGRFYLDNGKDLGQALEWMDMACQKRPEAFWYTYQKARILAEMGKKEEAIATAKKSMEMAKKSERGDFGYIARNQQLIDEMK